MNNCMLNSIIIYNLILAIIAELRVVTIKPCIQDTKLFLAILNVFKYHRICSMY